ncbi:MAG TPA: MFS transporter [Spirochaetota bacterium]|jgi:MFS family permease|nr:MFS transporter [Spirochaetota bacterium]HNU91175.1 MFS transporter [Spirochaetota bacterium]HPV97536.1 MFS transporter [Spirochaetota bacterium]
MEARPFNTNERRLITGISLVMGIRMLGISMIIPVFSIFATELPGSTGALAGLAVGIFGIIQILLQVPIGKLSDRWGRKQVTLAGLVVYFIGSVLSGLSQNIHHLIAARVLSGAGAIQGVTMAWLTDGISLQRRNTALSYVGLSMGLAVIFGFTLSPIIAAKINIPVLFFLCAALVLVTIVYTAIFMDNQSIIEEELPDIKTERIWEVMKNADLNRLNVIGFVGNLNINAVFFVMPLLFKKELGMEAMWKIFIPVSIIGTALMFVFARQADRRGSALITAVGLAFEFSGILLAIFAGGLAAYIVSFFLFYAGHCILSPVLPAAASRYPNAQLKGTVLSIFNSSQFLGSGIGGLLSGLILELDYRHVFVAAAIFTLAAFVAIAGYRDFGRGIRAA